MGTASSAIDPERYAVLGLTHVQYDPTDPLAKLLALVTLSPIFLLCSYVTIILYRRELTFVNALIGQLGCEGVNWGLKRLIRQPRPTGKAIPDSPVYWSPSPDKPFPCHPTDHLGKGYGMPSSHSQFLGFFCAFFLAHFYLHHPKAARPRTLVNTMRRLEHWFAMACILGLTTLTCYSRWHLTYHSTSQVLAGLTLGLIIGSIYYYITEHLPRQPLRLPMPLGSPTSSPAASPTSGPVSRKPSVGKASQSQASLRQRKTGLQSQPTAPSGQQRTHKRRRSSLAAFMPELHPAPPLRQLILDHPIAVALRLRDSWTVWLDGGIEGEYEAWRLEWERRRPTVQQLSPNLRQVNQAETQTIAERLQRTTGIQPDRRAGESPSEKAISVDEFFAGDATTQSDLAAATKSNSAVVAARATASAPANTTSAEPHYSLMLRTLKLASQCPPTSTAFCVGCVITLRNSNQVLSTGYSRETGDAANEHAEQVALNKLSGRDSFERVETGVPVELDLYTSMEPCSERLSGALPCVQRILAFNEHQSSRSGSTGQSVFRITRVFQGIAEPADFISQNTSSALLRSHSIELLTVLPPLLAKGKASDQSSWIEREALRLAKHGHPDQPQERHGESLAWKGVE